MKKSKFLKHLLLVVSLCCYTAAFAQVDNYCIRLSNGGSVDCGSMPELDGKSAYTIQFWMKPGTWKNNSVILSRGDGFKIQTKESQTIEIVAGGNSHTVTDTVLVEGQWAQLTFIYANNAMNILVNGNQAVSKSGDFTLPASDIPFTIGGGFDGCIDELRVWNAELRNEFNYFINNTINKFVPQLDDLVAYFKFDQEQCPNIVDYKALFKPSEYNHHGVVSGNVQREIVTDNTGMPYLLCGAYTENNKFFWGQGNREQYLLANDIIILGIQMYADGHLEYRTPNNHATLVNADWLSSYQGRDGVVSLNGAGSKLQCTDGTLKADSAFTFETWIYLENWTEGAYIFRKETSDLQNGLAIYLGEENTKQLIVRCNGKKYVNENKMQVGRWVHLGIASKNGGTTATTFLFSFDGTEAWATESLSDGGTNARPTGMASEIAYIGENLNAKLDNTTIWNTKYDLSGISGHMTSQPMPAISGNNIKGTMDNASAFYKYDKADNPGYSTYSQDEIKNLIESCYEGYRGYQIRISVAGSGNWISLVASDANCENMAKELAKLSEGYDGVELDLEWMYANPQANLRKFAQAILKELPAGKTLHISVHARVGAYHYPVWHMSSIAGFTVQNYGPQKANFNMANFKADYNTLKNWGFPNDKLYMAFATTTSKGDDGTAVAGYKKLDLTNYTPETDGTVGAYGAAGTNISGKGPYYFTGSHQTYLRAKFCVDSLLQGIFYWDMVNDIHPTADADNYSLAKYCNYGLASNVDTLVTAVDVRHLTPIVLDENSTTAPAAASGVNVRVLRTIKANEWGTICLPFAMTAEQVTAAFGPDVKLSDFTGYTATKAANGNTIDITVNFSPVTPLAVAANHPYIIKVSNGVTEFSVKDVNIVPAEPTINRGTEDEPKAIVGTYVADTTVPNLCLFLNGGNFYYSKGLTRMKGFRAYFDFYDVLTSVANSSNAGAKIGLNIEGETTSLNEELRMKSEESVGEWYSIDGRKLNGEPTRKGVYIRDGRKVVVK